MLYLGITTTWAMGDAARGKTKAASCAACHGPTGISPTAEFPNLAGQQSHYTRKQLLDYRLGTKGGRPDPVMISMASALSDEDIADLAAYYAKQQPAQANTTATSKQGLALYYGGNFAKAIPACTACHGPHGQGINSAAYPDLRAQHADYTVKQLQLFRSGERHNDPNDMMRSIAAKLTDAEIHALAIYLAGMNSKHD